MAYEVEPLTSSILWSWEIGLLIFIACIPTIFGFAKWLFCWWYGINNPPQYGDAAEYNGFFAALFLEQ